ncbi:Uncharacterised protein [Mycobacteroides abscessus]|nr:Uncharacterised protein [Mycobacteroides abscessus]
MPTALTPTNRRAISAPPVIGGQLRYAPDPMK